MARRVLSGQFWRSDRPQEQGCHGGYDEGESVGSDAAEYSASSGDEQTIRWSELSETDVTRGRVTKTRCKDGAVASVVSSAIVVRDEDGQSRYVIARAAPVEPARDVALDGARAFALYRG
jgi:hypothetical protein